LAKLRARSLRRIIPAVSSTAAVPPPKVPSTGASGRWTAAPPEPPDMSIPGISGDIPAGGGGVGELPDMSIPGMSAGMLGVGAGELPDMSIPGMSAGMLAVGAGEAPDMSIPGMSAGMLAVGAGAPSDPTPTGTAVALSAVAADDSCAELSINAPKTAIPAAVVPTDTTRNRRRQRRTSPFG
jgi:hypothetical protein